MARKKIRPARDGGFSRTAETVAGYRRVEVDRLFTRLANDYEHLSSGAEVPSDIYTSRSIRQVIFQAEPGGYNPVEVDRALEQVGERFAKLERSRYIQRYGLTEWERSLRSTGELLAGRLERPRGEKFRRPTKRKTVGYFISEEPLDAGVVQRASFRPATGSVCYDETQVDAFLDRCIELLQDLA